MSDTATLLADLECVVQELSDRVTALTDAVDALMDELQWRNNHTRDNSPPPQPFVLTSMPIDPCTDDWEFNRVNRDGRTREPSKKRRSPGTETLFD